ncbi:MAG: metal-dependent transcriptional regulator [Lachnospiraceae bacterium]|nr:metal-dependent transcriptional regulator [Lachnospiraceae bacterium]
MYESGENYLETILMLKKERGAVRSVDIAREMNFSKPSISRAMGILREEGFIVMDRDGYIELTEAGKAKAESIYERHRILTQFLELTAGVSAEIAEKDACKMEHILSNETVQGIKVFLERENNRS